MNDIKICPQCNSQILADAKKCRFCGAILDSSIQQDKPKEFLVTLLLVSFLGNLGIHRFYTGYIGIGLAQLLTFGGCGLWQFIDFVSICFNKFKDEKGRELYKYNRNWAMAFFFLPMIVSICIFLMVLAGAKLFPCSGPCPIGR